MKFLLVFILQFAFGVHLCAASQPAPTAPLVSNPEEVGGRVLIMFHHPVLAAKMWAGTTHGGLWQSVNAGASWTAASSLFQGMAVGAVTADPLNPDVMYAGTGEGRSNRAELRGHGMFKSTDGGATWAPLPLTDPATVGERWSHINDIAISSTGVLLAATSDDQYNGYIYRSVDGGETWGLFPVYDGSKVGPHNMIYKLRFDPDNPNTAIFMDAYASVTHSTDGGVTWRVAKKSTTCP
jgi:photosystem II stability/assembly factor-like uncharacterized protein